MLFSSWQFIFVFLPIVTSVFFLLPAEPLWFRKLWLLIGSIFFYAYWKIEYVPLLLFSMGFNYTVAGWLTSCRKNHVRRSVCAFGIAINLLLLGYFKYANFFAGILGETSLIHHSRHFDIILPLAISFFTFTQIGYLVDVYRDSSVHYGLFDYAVFVVFFPHLIAGPIVRHWEIIPQFSERKLKFNVEDLKVGVAYFLMGLYKKVLLADPFAPYVSRVYDGAASGQTLTWFDACLGTLAFALQIYFDFSGYSDMAIGLARMFTIKFPINFNSPYKAASIGEFWQRWHITLTRFFREYVYFPMGGNRRGDVRQGFNAMATMLLSGLWHGAGWTFVIWGGLHGVYLVAGRHWGRLVGDRVKMSFAYRSACWLVTFVAVLAGWVFFRAPNLHTAGVMFTQMTGFEGLTVPDRVYKSWHFITTSANYLGIKPVKIDLAAPESGYTWLAASLTVALVAAVLFPNTQELLASHAPALEPVQKPWNPFNLRLGLSSGIVLGALLVVVVRGFFAGAPSPFLYFNF